MGGLRGAVADRGSGVLGEWRAAPSLSVREFWGALLKLPNSCVLNSTERI